MFQLSGAPHLGLEHLLLALLNFAAGEYLPVMIRSLLSGK
jgi:hypothetical protein